MIVKHVIAFLFAISISGCGLFISSATRDMTDNLTYAILNNNDLVTVKEGGPAYLLLIDGFVHSNPKNDRILLSAANLYNSYTALYVTDAERAEKMTSKALKYALDALCLHKADACMLKDRSFESFTRVIAEIGYKDLRHFYILGSAWAGWIQAHRKDWNAIAEISRVEAIMERIVEIDDSYNEGGAHLYLGILYTLIPSALGGTPEKGRKHFELAIKFSGGKNLMAKVSYARQYARLIFDRKLHDRLLREVLDAEPDVAGYALINNMAQKEARELLNTSDEYF